jgi:hypothetical protein
METLGWDIEVGKVVVVESLLLEVLRVVENGLELIVPVDKVKVVRPPPRPTNRTLVTTCHLR